MAITVRGILKSPQGLAIQNAELLFEQTRTTEEVLQGTKFSINTQPDGAYSSTIGVGVFTFKIRFQEETQYRTIASNVIVSQAMDNYSINQIIQDQSQMQDVDYDLLQAVLQARDIQVQQATEASQSQDQAQESQTSSQASQTYSQQQQEASQSSQQSQSQSQSQQATSQSNAKGSETQAQQSQTSAATSAEQAQNSKDIQYQNAILAGESKDQAKASQDQQKVSETNQQGSQQQAQTSQANASSSEQSQLQSKVQAKASEVSAQSSAQAQLASQNQQAQSQSEADLSEAAALSSKNQAALSQDQQYSSSQQAAASKEEAKAWASKPEDQVVQEGLYSARHYAAKAANYAQTQLGQLIWRGGWSAQTGQTPPTPTGSTQDFYRITQAGTILGISYDVGDYIHWDTINSIWFKMDGTDSVTSVNGDTGQVNLTQQKVGAVESHTWLAKVKLGTWSAIGRFYPHLLGGKAIVTVGMTRGNFVANARFLISWGHAQHATITQLESHAYSQIMVRVGTTVGDSCIFSILDEDYGVVQQGTEVEYFCQVDSLFGQLDKYTSFTEDTSTAKSTLNTEYKAIKIGNNKVYHQGFVPTAQEVGAFPSSGGYLQGWVLAKQYIVAESLDGKNWVGIEAMDGDAKPYISAKVNNVTKKVVEFNADGSTTVTNNLHVNGQVASEAWGTAFEAIGGSIRQNNTSIMSLDGKTYSFVTSPADAHLCQNSYWDGVNWLKYDVSRASGHIFIQDGVLKYHSSDAGNTNPGQNVAQVYHSRFKPTPADIGALQLTGGEFTNAQVSFTSQNAMLSIANGSSIRYYNGNSTWFHTSVNSAGEFQFSKGAGPEASLATLDYNGVLKTLAQGTLYGDTYRPTPQAIGAAAASDVYSKQHVDDKAWMRVLDMRGQVRPPNEFGERSITAWFNETGKPSGGWYSGITVRGWADTYASWELLSGSDTPVTQAADQAKTALWFRSGSDGAWGDYQMVYTTKHKPSYAEVGAAPTGYGLGELLPGNLQGDKNLDSFKLNGFRTYNAESGDLNGPTTYGNVLDWGHIGNASNFMGWAGQLFLSNDGRLFSRVNKVPGSFQGATWSQFHTSTSICDFAAGISGVARFTKGASALFTNDNSAWFHQHVDTQGVFRISQGNYAGEHNLVGVYSDGSLSLQSGSLATYGGADGILSLNAAKYAFVTSPQDAHLCFNAYYQGTNNGGWKKYDNARPSCQVLVNHIGFMVQASGAGNANPTQTTLATLDYAGNLTLPEGGYISKNGFSVIDTTAESCFKAAITGGHWQQWRERPAALVVSCPNAESAAHQLIKATKWGAADMFGMDVHMPGNQAASTVLSFHLGSTNNAFDFYASGLLHLGDIYVRSDSRLKSDLKPIESALSKVGKLNGYSYDKKVSLQDTSGNTTREAGLIAQEVGAVLPEAVAEMSDSTQTISNAAVTALLVEAIKELKAELDELRGIVYGS